MSRKGILLAAGHGKRFYPVTVATNKHLLAVYDKPMFFYPLSMLMLADIRDILVITRPRDIDRYRDLLGDGSTLGLTISYAEQEEPNGIAEAMLIAEQFLDGSPSCLILGDNIFHGHGLGDILRRVSAAVDGATVLCYQVKDPRRFGVAGIDDAGNVLSIEEKPDVSASPFAVTGLYFLDGRAAEYAGKLKPSPRGELEITDLLKCYLEAGALKAEVLGRGTAWMDMGTPEALVMAADYIRAMDTRQRMKIACLEEISWNRGWIDKAKLSQAADKAGETDYGRYLKFLVDQAS